MDPPCPLEELAGDDEGSPSLLKGHLKIFGLFFIIHIKCVLRFSAYIIITNISL